MTKEIVVVTLVILASRPQAGFADSVNLHFDGQPSTADVEQALGEVGDGGKFQELFAECELPELSDLTTQEISDISSLDCLDPAGEVIGKVFVEYQPLRTVSTVEVE